MLKVVCKLISLLLISLFSCLTLAKEFRFAGHAYSFNGKTHFYSEYHTVRLDDEGNYREASVDYLSSENKLIARKYLNFQNESLMPNMRFIDFRSGKGVDVVIGEQKIDIQRTTNLCHTADFSKSLAPQGQVQSSKTVKRSKARSVFDAGFDRMAAQYWPELSQGKKLKFDFFALSRNRFIGFELKRTKQSNELNVMQIAPRNWFIDLLMDPITLEYDKKSERLRRYRGVTNIIAEKNGKLLEDNFHAEIRYEYFDEVTDNPDAKNNQTDYPEIGFLNHRGCS